MTVTVVVLAQDEAQRIAPTLEALTARGVTAFVVDGGSIDGTRKIVLSAGHRLVEHPFEGFSAQRNWAMATVDTPYVLFVDADEIVSAPLWQEVLGAIREGCDAAYIPTLDYFAGRWMFHGGWYPQAHLRLLRTAAATYGGSVHEEIHFLIDQPTVLNLDHPLIHRSHLTLSDYLRKLDRYTEIEAANHAGRPWLLLGRGCAEAVAVLGHRLVIRQAWKDGPQGVIGAVSLAFYHFTVWAKAATASPRMSDTPDEAQRVWRWHRQ